MAHTFNPPQIGVRAQEPHFTVSPMNPVPICPLNGRWRICTLVYRLDFALRSQTL